MFVLMLVFPRNVHIMCACESLFDLNIIEKEMIHFESRARETQNVMNICSCERGFAKELSIPSTLAILAQC